MAREVFSTKAGFEQKLTELGFVNDGDKWYFKNAGVGGYLQITYEGYSSSAAAKLEYIGSNGSTYSITNVNASSYYLIMEYYELAEEGVAFKIKYSASSTANISESLQISFVKNSSEDGYMCIFRGSPSGSTKYIFLDNFKGNVTEVAMWSVSNVSNTEGVVCLAPIYTSTDGFVDVLAKSLILSQSLLAVSTYEFDCDGKSYIAWINSGSSESRKDASVVFEK